MSTNAAGGDGRWRIVALFFAAGSAALLALLVIMHRDEVVALGVDIRWDDFAFSAVAVREEAAVGPPGKRVAAAGRFVVVKLKVTNGSKRLDYALDRHRPVLREPDGTKHEVDPRANELRRLETGAALPPPSIPAGADHTSEVVFDVPTSARKLELEISWGFDAIDGFLYGDRRIRLGS
jgi:hypothetical protein